MAKQPTERQRRLADEARERQRRGESPNSQQQAALERVLAYAEEQKRWEFLQSTPKRDVARAMQRQHKVLDDWATRHGLPVIGDPVDLVQLLAWLANFLRDNSRRLGAEDETGVASPALERQRAESAEIMRLRRLAMAGTLSPRKDIRATLGRVAALLRSAGELLERDFGPDARAILDEALDDAEREIAAFDQW